ncbi:sugar kinase [Clavibacter michiganensis]|nr:sugar kinase [Clavibacter michiganensis]
MRDLPVAPRVVTLGEGLALVRGDGLGSFAHLASAVLGTGGAEANVAIGLSRLGIGATWLGRMGDDSLGRRVMRELRAEGVDARVVIDDSAPTGLMLKELPAPGRTVVTFYRAGSAGSRLGPADVALLDIPSAALLHVTGILPALSPVAAAASAAAVQSAQENGVPISFDVNHRERLWRAADAAPHYQRLASAAQIVFGGVDELELLVGSHTDDRSLAKAVAALGPADVIVKRGEQGAAVLSAGEWAELPASPVTVVDTVGAGDAFVAGYLAERLNGAPVALALATAVRTGAAACESPGDWEGASYRSDLERAASKDPVSR